MQQLFGSLTTVANQTDVLGDSAFRASITNGNRDLQPETVDTYNVGFSWAPSDGFLEGLSVDVDYYYRYDYTDIISRQASAWILLGDNLACAQRLPADRRWYRQSTQVWVTDDRSFAMRMVCCFASCQTLKMRKVLKLTGSTSRRPIGLIRTTACSGLACRRPGQKRMT